MDCTLVILVSVIWIRRSVLLVIVYTVRERKFNHYHLLFIRIDTTFPLPNCGERIHRESKLPSEG